MRGVFLVNHGGAIKFFVTYEGGEDGQAALNLYNFTGRVICISHRK